MFAGNNKHMIPLRTMYTLFVMMITLSTIATIIGIILSDINDITPLENGIVQRVENCSQKQRNMYVRSDNFKKLQPVTILTSPYLNNHPLSPLHFYNSNVVPLI